MSFISLFKNKVVLIVLSVVISIELVATFTEIYFYEHTEVFLINNVRKKMESGGSDYKGLIFGDSRSMSLIPSEGSGIYNFSLPAMGARYYVHYLSKYLKAGNKKPEFILFASSPGLIAEGYGDPIIDPSLIKYVKPNMSLSEYLKNRFISGLTYRNFLMENASDNMQKVVSEINWKFFSHRILHLFSVGEMFEQYKGPELLYVLSASIPNVFSTYRYRKALLNVFSYENYKSVETAMKLDCGCEELYTPRCMPPESNFRDNRWISEKLSFQNGGLNISDRIKPQHAVLYQMSRDKLKEEVLASYKVEPNFDFSAFEDFLEYTQAQNINVYYILMPFPEYTQSTGYFSKFWHAFESLNAKYPHLKVLQFEKQFMKPEYYSDQIHLNCQGAKAVNEMFYKLGY
ncbi:hypothetical protein IQB76_04585 [Leptospira borgpetersenii serovar Hardjo-bovis]|uniref:DUF1574 domain-containing protein n=1 Tax=Leptospira borgpetersenii serovar Hardjo-bovis str. Sponselee TaxID=1303729 RepID=M6C9R4_LEPBO|nr:hypothetical protein [Leptospira borgpetersenii]ABJ79571.1 Hypothetical protein LBL_2159 [Leptospira borgpetersenii serovar Hardjo-bovis str. L550]AMX58912.1 hypothetical protein LBK6_11370 [Leptospira borgpetersenii serovar Hardjo]AMX62166.1 hypothetical protein LBK9_11415 [Leptospira borgpetersenii serovar Hardjo]AMX65409.1 hypothetical protein LBK30_11435 [Leptospira borgpetersenii serovar Hardjo]AMX68619.1 hypothetical protein LBHA_11270 [Leptospira borgpetersenii serovar Hardjo]